MPLPPPRQLAQSLDFVAVAHSLERALVYVNEGILIGASVTFVWGSFCFHPGWTENYELGCVLFIVGSLVFLGKSVVNMYELLTHHGVETISEEMAHFAEFCEHICYVASCLLFVVGSILFWPGVYGDSEENKLTGETIAVWTFIIGSLGFAVASFFNAILLSKTDTFQALPGEIGRRCYQLACWTLLCSQLGALLFVTGSFMYHPGYNNHCQRSMLISKKWKTIGGKNITFDKAVGMIASQFHRERDAVKELIPHRTWCRDILTDGTRLYIIGSVLYLLQALLYLRITWIKQVARDENDNAYAEDTDDSEDGEDFSEDD